MTLVSCESFDDMESEVWVIPYPRSIADGKVLGRLTHIRHHCLNPLASFTQTNFISTPRMRIILCR